MVSTRSATANVKRDIETKETQSSSQLLLKRNQLLLQLKFQQFKNNTKRSRNAGTQVTTQCFFLKWLPLEIRIMVYRELLCQPSLYEHMPMQSRNARIYFKYHLFPQILRTCRQIWAEASLILYEENTFAIACLGPDRSLSQKTHQSYLHCPLTRYNEPDPPVVIDSLTGVLTGILAIHGFRRVRRWRIFVSQYSVIPVPSTLIRFCEAISITVPTSVEIDIVDWYLTQAQTSMIWGEAQELNFAFMTKHSLEVALAPLNLVRGVQAVEIFYKDLWARTPVECKLGGDLKTLMEQGPPVENSVQMYFKLAYFAHAMTCVEKSYADTAKVIHEELQAQGWIPRDLVRFKHTTTQESSSISEYLKRAKKATRNNDVATFKMYRRVILHKLEVRYHRLVTASAVLAQITHGWNSLSLRHHRFSIYLPRILSELQSKQGGKIDTKIWRHPEQTRVWYCSLAIFLIDDLAISDIAEASTHLEHDLSCADLTDLMELLAVFMKDNMYHRREIQRTARELFIFDIDQPGFDRGCVTNIGLEDT